MSALRPLPGIVTEVRVHCWAPDLQSSEREGECGRERVEGGEGGMVGGVALALQFCDRNTVSD